ncbi:MAG: response regulator [Alphaproteobacteria bacterium]|nr:response regulator [Alphaproteobacteria bacterium]
MIGIEKEKPAVEQVNIPVSGPAAIRILVVEDDTTHRTLMENILREYGFSTVGAEDGYAALAHLDAGKKFNLIIMDWDMPGLDGLETVKIIRARQGRGELPFMPVLAFTGNRQPGDREKCLAAGMDAYLPKDVWMPRWRKTLLDNLEGLLAGKFDVQDFSSSPPSDVPGTEKPFDPDAFDPAILEETRLLLRGGFSETVEDYLEDAAAYIRDIKDGLEKGDADKAARGSHPLKSNSKALGLMAVSAAAESINLLTREAAKSGASIEAARPWLKNLLEAFERAEKRLHDAVHKARP